MYKLFVIIGLLLIAVGLYDAVTPIPTTGLGGTEFFPLMVIFGGILFLIAALFPSPKPKNASKSTPKKYLVAHYYSARF